MEKKNKSTIKIINSINNFLYKKRLILPKQNILIALSGGQDSVCLIFILLHLQKQWNWKIIFTFSNHLWQKESFETMRQLHKLSFLFCIKFFLIITTKKLFTEQKARNWRQYSWQRLLLFSESNWLVTGHTASDRIETSLIQLIRGSGTKGINSLHWQKRIDNPLNPKRFNSNFYKFNFCFISNFFVVKKKNSNIRKNQIFNKFLQQNFWTSVVENSIQQSYFFLKKKKHNVSLCSNKQIYFLTKKKSATFFFKKNFKLLENYVYLLNTTQKIILQSKSRFVKIKKRFLLNNYSSTISQYCISKKFLIKPFFHFYLLK